MRYIRRLIEITRNDGVRSAARRTLSFMKTRITSVFLYLINGRNWETIREINGSKMKLTFNPGSPQKIERTLYYEGVREQGATNLFTQVLTSLGSQYNRIHVFDVGANIGYFTLLEAKVLPDSADIYAIEAEPNNAQRLKQNLSLNGYDNVRVIQAAAGSKKPVSSLALTLLQINTNFQR